MQPEITVIIPVYNASATLERCVQSLLSQRYEDYEILLVNDGSEDNSEEIMKQFALLDKRVTVINLAHAGVSAARNLALAQANGRYICFVDADDHVAPDYLSTLYEYHEYDLVLCGYEVDYEDACGHLYRKAPHPLLQTGAFDVSNGFDALYPLFESGSIHINCIKLYRADIIRLYNISYPDIPINEDFAFTIEYLKYAKSLYATSKSTYHWVRVENRQTGVDSLPDNLIDIYTEACENTKVLFRNPKLVDRFFYYTYELVARKYMKAMKHGQMSKVQGRAMLKQLIYHPSVKSSFRMHHPETVGASIPYILLRFGFFDIYEKIYIK